MNISKITERINNYKKNNKKLFTTSSFQTHSIVLLHIISQIDVNIPVYFLNTGFHFPETIEYKNKISKLLNLNIKDLNPEIPKILQRNASGQLLFTSDPDYCCYLNKVNPLDRLLLNYDVWINGVRADQTKERKDFKEEEESLHNTIRFHPLLDWTKAMINEYIIRFNLPPHPLDKLGYQSIGCEPCTIKVCGNDLRASRWYGLAKNECGINTDLIVKK